MCERVYIFNLQDALLDWRRSASQADGGAGAGDDEESESDSHSEEVRDRDCFLLPFPDRSPLR